MTLNNIEVLTILFLIYSFGGWLIETVLGIFENKKFVNRGFLLGPYCPIYGTGVILITLLLSRYSSDYIVLFFLSAILCGTLEYFTSYIMEKLFNARWWDYSNMKYNINGRICLETLVLFGFAGIFIISFLNPFFASIVLNLPTILLHIFSATILICILIDCIISFNVMNSIKNIKRTVSSQIKDNTEDISKNVREILMQKSLPYRRFISAFPQAFADKIKEGKAKLEKAKENFSEVKEKVIDNITEAKERVVDNLNETKEKVIDNLAETKERVVDNLNETKEKVKEDFSEAKEKFKETANNKILNIKEITNYKIENIKKKNSHSNKNG